MLTFIDFFSGIGGFRLGMEQAGHTCRGHCEIDKYANISYNAIHQPKGDEWFATDIRAVEPGELPDADCWCCGFPCQAFSIAGKRKGLEDMRGTLIFEVFRLAAERKPSILFLENVAGLLSHDEGRTFATILCGLWELGYDVQWQVLNSKDFGVPQNRERIFIVGYLGAGSPPEVFPFREGNSQTLKQLVGGQQGNRVYDTGGVSCTLSSEGGGQGAKTGLYLVNKQDDTLKIRDDNTTNCIDANYYKGLDAHQARTGVLEVRPVLTPDRPEKRQNGRRFKEPGEPMFTLTAQDKHGVLITEEVNVIDVYNRKRRTDGICGTVAVNGNFTGCGVFGIQEGARIRKLTPRECWRLQGFPDWAFDRARDAGMSDTQLYKQAGNSVTVPVIYEIARRLG